MPRFSFFDVGRTSPALRTKRFGMPPTTTTTTYGTQTIGKDDESIEVDELIEVDAGPDKCDIDDRDDVRVLSERDAVVVDERDDKCVLSDIEQLAEQLRIAMTTIEGFKTESDENSQVISMLGREIAEKNCIIEKMSEDCNDKNISLEANAAEIADLTHRLHLKAAHVDTKDTEIASLSEQLRIAQDENGELKVRSKALVACNRDSVEQMNKLEDDVENYKNMINKEKLEIHGLQGSIEEKMTENAALKEQLELIQANNQDLVTAVEAIVASTKDNAQQLSVLEADLEAKTKTIDEMSEEIQHKNMLLDEKAAENGDLTIKLQSSMAERYGLKTEVEALVVSNENLKKINTASEKKYAELLDTVESISNADNAKTAIIDGMRTEIQQKIASIKERGDENIGLTEQLQSKTAENADLVAEIQILLDTNKEIKQQMFAMEENLLANKIKIDAMSAEIALLGEKPGEIAVLTHRLELFTNESEVLKRKIDEKIVKITDLTEKLQLIESTKDGLKQDVKSLVAANEDASKQISFLEKDSEAKQIAIDEMSADMNENIASLKEKSAEIDVLMERLRLSESECIDQRAEIEELIANKTDIIQQMSVLEDDLTAKKILIDEMSADFNQKNVLLEEKSAEIADISYRLQISMAEKHGLKTEVDSLVASNKAYVKNISSLNEDLAAKMIANDEMNENIQLMIDLLNEKSVVIAELTKRLNLSKAENDERQAEIDMKSAEINVITARLDKAMAVGGELKTTVESLNASNEEHVHKISIIEDDLATSKSAIVEMNADIHHKNKLLEDKSLEIADLTDRLLLLKDESELLIASNEDHIQQISLLEADMSAKNTVIEDMTLGIRQRNTTIEDQSVEILALSDALQQRSTENDKYKMSNKDHVQKVSLLEDDLAAKKIEVTELSANIRHMSISFQEKSAEIASLIERLQQSKGESEHLKSEVESLVDSNKEKSCLISNLEDELESKNITIDDMTTNVNNLSYQCRKMETDYATLEEKLNHAQAENGNLTKSVQEVESMNKKCVSEIVQLNSLLEDYDTRNKSLQVRFEEVDSRNNKLKSIITPLKESNSELLEVVNSTSKALDDERSFRDKEIIEVKKTNAQLLDLVECMTQKLDDETAKYEENVTNMRKMMKIQKEDNTALVQSLQIETKSLATQLRLSKDESDIFKEEIRIMSKDIVELTTKYNTTVTQNDMYMKQLELSNTECSKLKAAIEDLESKIVNDANEVQNLSIALDDANNHFISVSEELGQVRTTSNKKITELQDALKSMAKLLSDERTSHDKQLDEMKKVFYNLNRMHEESLGDVTTKNLELKKTIDEQRKTIDDLCKSLDDAMIEIANKDIILEEKSTEIQKYLDLAAQFKSSDCAIGYGGFWR